MVVRGRFEVFFFLLFRLGAWILNCGFTVSLGVDNCFRIDGVLSFVFYDRNLGVF